MESKKAVLITGGAGYIGSHTAVELIGSGYEVIVVDNLSNSNSSSIDGIEKITGVRPAFEEVDTCNFEQLESVLELITTFERVNGLKLPYKMAGRRPGDVTAVWAETSKANGQLG